MTEVSKTEYTLEHVQSLQRHVQRNANLWVGLMAFYLDVRPENWNEDLFYFWGPMAEDVLAGKDVVKEHFAHL